ncbi:MAG: ferredoxin [Deltaproteobacteria bacterium RIFCSPHIGHO2_12_FULL_43_9]|nr:MAG: ferredoxin [Deltaproteobacteria bacterium RIFCSPHIGHO2_12_FULL_43_9]
MTYVICEPCIGVKDTACVDVCPVDCIKQKPDNASEMLYIDPAVCIDCGACIPACPVEAIFPEDEVPEKWGKYTQINADFFK